MRDFEVSNEERRREEDRRVKETVSRLEREKSMETETHLNRIYSLQQELVETKEDLRRCQHQLDKIKSERNELQDLVSSKQEEIDSLKQELAKDKEFVRRHREDDVSSQRIIQVLNQELLDLKTSHAALISSRGSYDESLGYGSNSSSSSSPNHSSSNASSSNELTAKIKEMSDALSRLRTENENLRESNEELQAQLLTSRLEEGRCLVRETGMTNSLADELITLNEEQVSLTLDCHFIFHVRKRFSCSVDFSQSYPILTSFS